MEQGLERWLGPGEAAAKLGVTVKALRVYERRGLVTPARTSGRWRVYGPAQIARIYMIVVMRDLGFSLQAIGALLDGKAPALSAVLTAHQDALEEKRRKISDAIALLHGARLALAQHGSLSPDDLTQLSREAVMENFKINPEVQSRLEKRLEQSLPPGQVEKIKASARKDMEAAGVAKAEVAAEAVILMEAMKRLMARGDPDSDAAKIAVLRWRNVTKAIGRPDPKARKAWMQGVENALADKALAPDLPFDAGLIAFMQEVTTRMKARGELP